MILKNLCHCLDKGKRIKVSVQGIVALFGGHFATLCRELDFYEAIFFSILVFKKKMQILLHF
jgi:hypothetical protein